MAKRGGAAGFAHARPEPLTEGTWNLLALAVHPAAQGRGLGGALVRGVEVALSAQGARLLIIDTAGGVEFAAAQGLYARLGYAEVARLPDFWAGAVDKVTFAKRLGRSRAMTEARDGPDGPSYGGGACLAAWRAGQAGQMSIWAKMKGVLPCLRRG